MGGLSITFAILILNYHFVSHSFNCGKEIFHFFLRCFPPKIPLLCGNTCFFFNLTFLLKSCYILSLWWYFTRSRKKSIFDWTWEVLDCKCNLPSFLTTFITSKKQFKIDCSFIIVNSSVTTSILVEKFQFCWKLGDIREHRTEILHLVEGIGISIYLINDNNVEKTD